MWRTTLVVLLMRCDGVAKNSEYITMTTIQSFFHNCCKLAEHH